MAQGFLPRCIIQAFLKNHPELFFESFLSSLFGQNRFKPRYASLIAT